MSVSQAAWHWDRLVFGADEPAIASRGLARVARWRCGPLLTVYRLEWLSGVKAIFFYLPFDVCVCLGTKGSRMRIMDLA